VSAVPPDILDSQTSNDVIVQEFENVTLSCTATGLPGERISSDNSDTTFYFFRRTDDCLEARTAFEISKF
jgi:hypothetical protein